MTSILLPPERAWLDDVALTREVLLDGCRVPVRNATVYTNITDLNPSFGQHLKAEIYVDRTCNVSAVALVRLDSDAVVHGGGEFLTTTRGVLLQEQVAPYLDLDPSRVAGILSAWRPIFRIREECLLVARFGIYTWGHWLAEILPKLVLVEARYPGRFRFLLPAHVWSDRDPNSAWSRIRESLIAYGIGPGRQILNLQESMDYQFDRLYAVSNVWSDHAMHPAAAEILRERLQSEACQPHSAAAYRIGLDRIGDGRRPSNLPEIKQALIENRFGFHTIGRMSFMEQVALFRSASVIFSVLGSDLTGLIFAPEGVKVISVAPSVFGDRFFYALILDRRGTYADVRGPITEFHPTESHRSTFRVDMTCVHAAMRALDEE